MRERNHTDTIRSGL